MLRDMVQQLKTSLLVISVLTIITGVIYPVTITVLAQLLFPHQANGSLIRIGDKVVGSELIGQNFSSDKYFHGRPSATKDFPYNAMYSSGSNYGPSNPEYIKLLKQRVQDLRKANHHAPQEIPVDLITASGSGLDPDISEAAAYYQVQRIADARKLKPAVIENLIKQQVKGDLFRIFATSRVNVLRLNLALDQIKEGKSL